MSDLFRQTSDERPQALDLPGADLRLFSSFLPCSVADSYFESLLRDTAWKENQVFVWGKWHKQPRLIAWHGDPDASYSYSGSAMKPEPWSTTLTELRRHVESASHARFNSVLLNLYRDQNDRMGWHRDNEPELGLQPTIASISLGATRDLRLKHRDRARSKFSRVALTHGSLLVMAGDTQKNWLHAINKQTKPCGPRINLTFRVVHGNARKTRTGSPRSIIV